MSSSSSPGSHKVAIVTGSTSGIGKWVAELLHKRGYRVALCGRREEQGNTNATALDATGETATFVQCDVASWSSQCALFKTVWAKWGRLDIVVANAGGLESESWYNLASCNAAIDELPSEPKSSCLDVDLRGAMYNTKLATHFMRHNPGGKGGKIIATGSMIGPCSTFPEYSTAKAGLHHWVKTVSPILLEKENIVINCVMPGAIETGSIPGFSDAFRPEHMTLQSNLLAGYERYIEDTTGKTGETIEAAHDTLIEWGHPGYKSGGFGQRTEKVYDPWFEALHGEKSGLTSAIAGPPTERIIAVTGATGTQGGGVINVMSKTPGWKVRALTRNAEGEAAKKLIARGIEVVSASFDDEDSLKKAFYGVHAVFAVTNWWEQLYLGKSRAEAGEIEERQGMTIARAAASIPTLEHYIWSTTPSSARMIKPSGSHLTPHMDYKANVDERIQKELPRLAAMTTYLYLGYYPQNMAFYPLFKPTLHPGNGQYVQTIPSKPDTLILNSGDMTVNPGIWTRQVLRTGTKAYGKYANVALEKWTFQQMLDEWSTITGKKGVYVQTTAEAWTNMWGELGAELADQLKFGELCDPWEETENHISPEELSIDTNEVVGFRGAVEALKHFF
ncbi:NAD(P)-binding protein [Periconia macrospinosa]|uniref:NAD(P)-binding protein n=1 Tax=Periconia macrospinosa TaxID=97972 RepID=A0A2V1E486_9PLEO|nr:NAD(P)-binding protein [Periconia macrospinosa]